MTTAMPSRPACSLVIPVYNGRRTIASVVTGLHEAFSGESFEVVLVDDGSQDGSDDVCLDLAERFPDTVRFVQLTRNFGEHSAVLAGLRHTDGDYVVVLDDDGQNPPAEALRLFRAIRESTDDVVYARYAEKHHGWLRNAGSRLNGWLTTRLLGKPPGLYLSSFKAMNRFLVDQIATYRGAWPYIDGLVLWSTRRIGQLDVVHHGRAEGRSNYALPALVAAWLRVMLNFSILPLRLAAVLGVACSLLSGLFLAWVIVDKLFINPDLPVGLPTIGVVIAFFAGVQLLILGVIGEYLGRLFLYYTGVPQYVVGRRTGRTRRTSDRSDRSDASFR